MRSSIKRVAGAFLCAMLLSAGVSRAGTVLPGFGAIGDSFADEYEFYPPDRNQARNFVEILAATRGLDFGAFSNTSRGSPRNQGYANDWALSGATSDDLPAQTAGLAPQIAAGTVGTVFVFIGGNDFIDAALSPTASQILPTLPQHVLTNTLNAVGTLLAANPNAHVVISNLFDISQLPVTKFAIAAGFITQAQADQISQLIDGYNSALAGQLAGNARATLVDLNGISKGPLSQPTFTVGGQTIDTVKPGDEYHHLFLNDGLHIGTVGQGLLANGYIAAVDSAFAAGITPLSDTEILQFAARVTPIAVPLPPVWFSGGSALVLVIGVTGFASRRIRPRDAGV